MTEAATDDVFSANEEHISEEQLLVIKEAFNYYDTQKQGVIPTAKLGEVMRNLGHNLRKDQLKELIDAVDRDGSGTIDFDEFLPLMAEKLKDKEDEKFYKNLFRILDKKNRGYILVDDLRYILRGLASAVDLTDDDIEDMITEVDEDGNGEVSFDEFYKLMTSE